MDVIKTLAYAGLGLAQQANDKMKNQFDELVEKGKKFDSEGNNYVGDFFKTVDSSKEDFESTWNKNKENTLPQIQIKHNTDIKDKIKK